MQRVEQKNRIPWLTAGDESAFCRIWRSFSEKFRNMAKNPYYFTSIYILTDVYFGTTISFYMEFLSMKTMQLNLVRNFICPCSKISPTSFGTWIGHDTII